MERVPSAAAVTCQNHRHLPNPLRDSFAQEQASTAVPALHAILLLVVGSVRAPRIQNAARGILLLPGRFIIGILIFLVVVKYVTVNYFPRNSAGKTEKSEKLE